MSTPREADRYCCASMTRTMHQDLVCELRAPGHRRVELAGGDVAERPSFREGHLARQRHVGLAIWRADQMHRVVLSPLKIDEDGRIVKFALEFLGLHRRLQR